MASMASVENMLALMTGEPSWAIKIVELAASAEVADSR